MQCPHTEHRLIVYVLCAFRLCQSNLRLLSSPLYLLCHLLHILNLAFCVYKEGISGQYAAYIIAKCGDITPLQLQKMLYYTQACFIIFYNKFAFSDECEAWVHGPVYRNLWEKYKDYKYESISQVVQIPQLKSEEEAILNLVIEYFGKYSGKVLEEFTHKELPWLKAREGLAQNEPSTRIIDNNLIFEYYTSIKNKYNIVSLADIQSYIDKLW